MFPLSCLSVLKMQKYQRCNIIAYFLFAPLARERCVDYFPKFNRLRKTAGWQLVVVVLRVCWLRIELAFIFLPQTTYVLSYRRPNAIRVARMRLCINSVLYVYAYYQYILLMYGIYVYSPSVTCEHLFSRA